MIHNPLRVHGPYTPPAVHNLRDELDRADLEQHINSVFASVDRLKNAMRLTPDLVTSEDRTFLRSAWAMLGILLIESQKAEAAE